jgi:hypothetical protein
VLRQHFERLQHLADLPANSTAHRLLFPFAAAAEELHTNAQQRLMHLFDTE